MKKISLGSSSSFSVEVQQRGLTDCALHCTAAAVRKSTSPEYHEQTAAPPQSFPQCCCCQVVDFPSNLIALLCICRSGISSIRPPPWLRASSSSSPGGLLARQTRKRARDTMEELLLTHSTFCGCGCGCDIRKCRVSSGMQPIFIE